MQAGHQRLWQAIGDIVGIAIVIVSLIVCIPVEYCLRAWACLYVYVHPQECVHVHAYMHACVCVHACGVARVERLSVVMRAVACQYFGSA